MPIRRRPARAEPPVGIDLGVSAVARRLGVATGTLRTWDRRYGLGPSAHEAGTRRRYTAGDLARLTLMRRLMLEGAATADAARAAAQAEVADLPGAGEPLLPDAPVATPRGRRARSGGGRVVATREAGPAARGLARAAMSLDSDACTALLRSSLVRAGVVATWNDVLLPVLNGVGERWRSTGAGVEVEHLLSECAEAALRGVEVDGPARNTRPVLLAALEPEDHRLPTIAVAAALAEHGVSTRSLGARLPARALVDAVSRTGALAVFLWSQGAAGPGQLPDDAALTAVRPRPVLMLGGPGWAGQPERAGVVVVADLASAVTALVAVVSGGVPAR
jgi:MerR family transcriptional regulator, light-induced transcriptional regulator